MSEPYALHWFRRDLRLEGNPSVQALHRDFKGRVLGVFCLDPEILNRADFSSRRLAFDLKTLELLKNQLRSQGGDLLLLEDAPEKAFSELLAKLKGSKSGLPQLISWNRDYEPSAIQRDSRMEELLQRRFGLQTETHRDHLLIEPQELTKKDSSSQSPFYQVYTPFKKRWLSLLSDPDFQFRVEQSRKALKARPLEFKLSWKSILEKNPPTDARLFAIGKKSHGEVSIPLPEPGHAAAMKTLRRFQKHALSKYLKDRDRPALAGTSHLSIYLKNGSITVPQIVAQLKLDAKLKNGSSEEKFLSELIWREFYYHILVHTPAVEHRAFNRKYIKLPWENRRDHFEAWCEGRTGYPIVDAGMRQMNQTGWMHNRVRMIVASFLTKDLLIDWRWGEAYFMKQLLDGDLALNNGGWQWAASTGCDPQPYFRIFNPASQSRRFDPKGDYIRRWVPELRDLSAKEIHEPHRFARTADYPPPIVDHSRQRVRALELFTKTKAEHSKHRVQVREKSETLPPADE